ncbi:MAG: hypothetical protein Q4C85_05035 [Actinomyces sp.]|uniref:hypothetical protein n=1 Tax=Actinomyces sp. TaxID=29317 RepID=UPI0026DCC480|nr:hypothetical protein [Actinomyces sp.]MDO4243115.1 hypothetical protein [Actinomyces sp.]
MPVPHEPQTAPPTPRWRRLGALIALDLLGVGRWRAVLLGLVLCAGAAADILHSGEVAWSGGVGIGVVCGMQAVHQSNGSSTRLRRLHGLLPVSRGEVVLARWLEAIGLLGGVGLFITVVGVAVGAPTGAVIWLAIASIGVAAGVPLFLCVSGRVWPVWIVAWWLGVFGVFEGILAAVEAVRSGLLDTVSGSNLVLPLVFSIIMGLSLAVTHWWYCRQDH